MSYTIQEWNNMRKKLEEKAQYHISDKNWKVLQDLFGIAPNQGVSESCQKIKRYSASTDECISALVEYTFIENNDEKVIKSIQGGNIICKEGYNPKEEEIVLIRKSSKPDDWEVYLHKPQV